MRRFKRVPTIYVLSKNKKLITIFHLKIIIFIAVKYCCILHGHVCVMEYDFRHSHIADFGVARPEKKNTLLLYLEIVEYLMDVLDDCPFGYLLLNVKCKFHYGNMPMQFITIFHSCKNENVLIKNGNFHNFSQNIDFGYTLEPPQ